MRNAFIAAAAFAAAISAPLAAQAQGTVIVEDRGTVGGPYIGIPSEQVTRFREYVVREHVPSYRYSGELRVGAVLPEAGVTYYDVPAEYHVTGYRYTYVNDHPVLVDPHSRRVVQVID